MRLWGAVVVGVVDRHIVVRQVPSVVFIDKYSAESHTCSR